MKPPKTYLAEFQSFLSLDELNDLFYELQKRRKVQSYSVEPKFKVTRK